MNLTAPDPRTCTPSCPIKSLPPDLIMIILEYLWGRDPEARPCLSSCSVVCSQWKPIAQALLFTEVLLGDEESAEKFLFAVHNNPLLGRATKILSLEYPTLRSYQKRRGFPVDPRLIRDITAHCTRLYQLNLEIAPHLSRRMLKGLLHLRTFITLQALVLRIDGSIWTSSSRVELEDVLHFLYQFHSLTHLRLENIHFLGAPFWRPLCPPLPFFDIYEFCWLSDDPYTVDSNTAVFHYIVDWLFGDPSEGPFVLALEEPDTEAEMEMLLSFIRGHGKDLISVSMVMLGEDLATLPLNLSEACPNLRELLIPSVMQMSSGLRSTIPITFLEHLELGEPLEGRIDESSAAEIIDWVTSLPNIRYVSFDLNTFEVEPDHYLVKLWRERATNIQLYFVTYMDIIGPDRHDLIRPFCFPRWKTIQNLSHMTIPPE